MYNIHPYVPIYANVGANYCGGFDKKYTRILDIVLTAEAPNARKIVNK